MNKILTYKEFEKIELKKINSIYINANLIFDKTHRANTTNTTNNTINIQKPIPPKTKTKRLRVKESSCPNCGCKVYFS